MDYVPKIAQQHLATWSAELLLALDWRRFMELTCALIDQSGYTISKHEISPDTSVRIAASDRRNNPAHSLEAGNAAQGADTLIQIAPWEGILVEDSDIHEFLKVGRGKGLKLIYITPDAFTREARAYGEDEGIELVDGQHMLRLIASIPEEHSRYFHQMATVGSYDVPSCPFCGHKMEVRDSRENISRKYWNSTLKFTKNSVVANDIACQRVIVKKGCEVHFLRSVTAAHIEIYGKAVGNFTGLEKIYLGPQAIVTGLVASRRMEVEEGAIIDGTTQVIDAAEIDPIAAVPGRMTWRCAGPKQTRHCRTFELIPRGEAA